MPIACGEIFVVALPGTSVRVQWVFKNGAIEHERVYYRPEIFPPVETGDLAQLRREEWQERGPLRTKAELNGLTTANLLELRERVEELKAEVGRLRQENADLRARMKPDAAFF